MERLGIAREAAAKMTRLPTGAAVLQHIAESEVADEIGFGQIPEIRRFDGKGVKLVGPLPREIGKVTTYAAGALSGALAPRSGGRLRRISGDTGRQKNLRRKRRHVNRKNELWIYASAACRRLRRYSMKYGSPIEKNKPTQSTLPRSEENKVQISPSDIFSARRK